MVMLSQRMERFKIESRTLLRADIIDISSLQSRQKPFASKISVDRSYMATLLQAGCNMKELTLSASTAKAVNDENNSHL